MAEPAILKSVADEVLQSRIEQAQNISPEQRILIGLEHSDLSMRVVEDGIRDQHPELDDQAILVLLIERIELKRRLEAGF